MVQPIGPLMWEHRLIEKIVPFIKIEVSRIEEGSEVDQRFIESAVDFFRVYADKTHHGKEEDILFKDLEEKQIKKEHKRVMDELVLEHVTARSKVSRLEDANNRWIDGDEGALDVIGQMLMELAELYSDHIEKEDKHFFHPIMKYFSQREQSDILRRFNEFDQNMIHWKYRQVMDKMGGENHLTQHREADGKKYRCSVCGYIYDPEKGDPENSVDPGTGFKELPDIWVCPVCYAAKNEFVKLP